MIYLIIVFFLILVYLALKKTNWKDYYVDIICNILDDQVEIKQKIKDIIQNEYTGSKGEKLTINENGDFEFLYRAFRFYGNIPVALKTAEKFNSDYLLFDQTFEIPERNQVDFKMWLKKKLTNNSHNEHGNGGHNEHGNGSHNEHGNGGVQKVPVTIEDYRLYLKIFDIVNNSIVAEYSKIGNDCFKRIEWKEKRNDHLCKITFNIDKDVGVQPFRLKVKINPSGSYFTSEERQRIIIEHDIAQLWNKYYEVEDLILAEHIVSINDKFDIYYKLWVVKS